MPVGEVSVKVPPQTEVVVLGTVNPTGSVSLKAIPLKSIMLTAGLLIVNCSEVV